MLKFLPFLILVPIVHSQPDVLRLVASFSHSIYRKKYKLFEKVVAPTYSIVDVNGTRKEMSRYFIFYRARMAPGNVSLRSFILYGRRNSSENADEFESDAFIAGVAKCTFKFRKYGDEYKIFEEVHTSINSSYEYPVSSIFINDTAIDKNAFAWNIAKHLTREYEICIRYKNRERLSKYLQNPYQITFTDPWKKTHIKKYPNDAMVNSYVLVNGKVPIGSFIITRAYLHSNWSVEFDAHYDQLNNTFLAETAWHGYMIASEIQNTVVLHSKPVLDGLTIMQGNYMKML